MPSTSSSKEKDEHIQKDVQATSTEPKYPDDLDLEKNPIKYATSTGELVDDAHDKEYMEMTLKSGNHSEVAQRILRQRIEARAKEFPRWPAEETTGARLMWIESRFCYDRERLGPDFDDDWRNYRAKYIHSLELDPREPLRVTAHDHELINPIRRFYMKAGDFLEHKIIGKFFTSNKLKAQMWRGNAARLFQVYMIGLAGVYWFTYCQNTWFRKDGLYFMSSKPRIFPNHPDFPFKDFRTEPSQHFQQGFDKRTVYKNLDDFEDTTVVL